MGYITLETYYQLMFNLMHRHKYRIEDWENFYPYEREIFLTMLSEAKKET
jgi:hypothetical protein